jgi:hypothetical protein
LVWSFAGTTEQFPSTFCPAQRDIEPAFPAFILPTLKVLSVENSRNMLLGNQHIFILIKRRKEGRRWYIK